MESAYFLFRSRSVITAVCLSALVGCSNSDSWKPKLYSASGVCRVNGMPASGALLNLIPMGMPVDIRETHPWGIVDQNGTFKLSTYQLGDGIPVGEYKLTLYWLVEPSDPMSGDRLKGKFKSVEKALRTVTIVAGENNLETIDIKAPDLLPSP